MITGAAAAVALATGIRAGCRRRMTAAAEEMGGGKASRTPPDGHRRAHGTATARVAALAGEAAAGGALEVGPPAAAAAEVMVMPVVGAAAALEELRMGWRPTPAMPGALGGAARRRNWSLPMLELGLAGPAPAVAKVVAAAVGDPPGCNFSCSVRKYNFFVCPPWLDSIVYIFLAKPRREKHAKERDNREREREVQLAGFGLLAPMGRRSWGGRACHGGPASGRPPPLP